MTTPYIELVEKKKWYSEEFYTIQFDVNGKEVLFDLQVVIHPSKAPRMQLLRRNKLSLSVQLSKIERTIINKKVNQFINSLNTSCNG